MALDVYVDAAALKGALNTVRGAVSARPVVPGHAFVHLTAENDRLVLTTTDGATAMEAGVAAQVDDWGAILVDHARLLAVVGIFDAAVRLTYNDKRKRVVLRCGKAEHVLPCADAGDFPPIQWEPDGAPEFALVATGEASPRVWRAAWRGRPARAGCGVCGSASARRRGARSMKMARPSRAPACSSA